MPVPSAITDLSTTPGSNSPSGSEAPTEGDNHLRTAYAFLRELYDTKVSAADLGTSGTVTLGDAMIAAKHTATGAVATDQHEINERYLDLFIFLTDAQKADVLAQTATLDCAAALNAAIAAAVVLKGKVIRAPTGKYRINSAIVWPVDWPIEICGEGVDASIFSCVGAHDGFEMTGTAGNMVVKSGLKNLRIVGSSGAVVGVDAIYCYACYLDNVRIDGFVKGVRTEQSWSLKFDFLRADANSEDGVLLGKESNDINLFACELLNNTVNGLHVSGARGVHMIGGSLEANGTNGARITSSTTTGPSKNIRLAPTYIEGNGTNEILITKDSGSAPEGVSIGRTLFTRLTGEAAICIRVEHVAGLDVDENEYDVGTATYDYSLYIADTASVSGIKFGRSNIDRSTSGVYRGTGTSYVDEAKQYARAWGTFTVSGAAIASSNSFGVTSITYVSTGLYEVTLRDAMPSVLYKVTCNAEASATHVAILCCPNTIVSTTVFRIQTAINNTTAVEAETVHFDVHAA